MQEFSNAVTYIISVNNNSLTVVFYAHKILVIQLSYKFSEALKENRIHSLKTTFVVVRESSSYIKYLLRDKTHNIYH